MRVAIFPYTSLASPALFPNSLTSSHGSIWDYIARWFESICVVNLFHPRYRVLTLIRIPSVKVHIKIDQHYRY